jgi:hypothetical protein
LKENKKKKNHTSQAVFFFFLQHEPNIAVDLSKPKINSCKIRCSSLMESEVSWPQQAPQRGDIADRVVLQSPRTCKGKKKTKKTKKAIKVKNKQLKGKTNLAEHPPQ